MLHYVEKIDGTMQAIIQECFPDYRGKKVKISTDIPKRLDSYWDGGSRVYYAFYSLVNGKTFNVESNHPMFEHGKPNTLDKLPERVLLVAHSIFCGKDSGITIYANAVDLAPMLPKNDVALTDNELIVLDFTRSYKANYAGRSNVRFYEAHRQHKITQDQWEVAKASCTAKGYLDKRGAITANGKNAINASGKRFAW